MTVPEIAKKCHVSVTSLKEVFNRYAGLSVHQYFLKLKLAHAYGMLKNGDSVAEVAATLSFSNPNYFCVAYKKENGVSPPKHRSS